MKTAVVLAGLIALVSGQTLNVVNIVADISSIITGVTTPNQYPFKTKTVDDKFVVKQKKVLSLLVNLDQEDTSTYDFYEIGKTYAIEANIENYTNKTAVQEFLSLYRSGFLPKFLPFSVFQERQRDEAIALFHLFYYAKDFDTFYKTAAYARVYHNEQQFAYAFYIAVLQRSDTEGIVLPALYEIDPSLFINVEELQHSMVKENNNYVFYATYSDSSTYPNEEVRLSYFTEDIGLNSYYYFFHSHFPSWWNSNKYPAFKERRGEIYIDFYHRLLSRYYLERRTNGLDGIPEFSWYSTFTTGYTPHLSTYTYPFAQRSNNYDINTQENNERISFLDSYEKNFKSLDKDVDFLNAEAINFAGNYWLSNPDLHSGNDNKDFQDSYEIAARRVLGGAPEPLDKYTFVPSSLDFYRTLRLQHNKPGILIWHRAHIFL